MSPRRSAYVVSLATLAVFASTSAAEIELYKDEAVFLDRLSSLGLNTLVTEGFESNAWADVRSPMVFEPHALPSVTSQGITWSHASSAIWGGSGAGNGVTTNHNWARSGQWGLFEYHAPGPFFYPTTIEVSSERTIYALGGWFNTNPDLQSVGFLFPDRTEAQAPGYVVPGFGVMYPGDNPAVGHVFVGIIDTDGFNSVLLSGDLEVNDKGQIDGAAIYGCDDFTLAVSESSICLGDCDQSGAVDFNDLVTMLFEFGAPDPGATCDADESGVVDFNDLVTTLFLFGDCA